MGSDISEPRRYAAFISYAHADELMAARLHKALETYPVPKHLRAQGKTTKPVFRDVAELTAAHSLSEKIRDAVKGSRVLIVLCSPAAKASHWVNEEIRLFRELHGDAAILSAIIDGTPETAFPDALTEDGREPLAAALGADKPGFKLGVTQLAAGMLGTGLDELVQRAGRRRNRIMGGGLAASLLLSGIMGFTAFQAVDARNEAQTARGEAEGLVEYMIKDLKVKLEPVGRLDLLEGIGDKAVEYYDEQDIKRLPDDSLTRQAAARQVLAQVHLDAGRMEDAQREIEASAALTREVLARNPDDTDAIFAHAQSEYWVGAYYRKQGKLAEMERPIREYDRLAQILYRKDSTNFDWVMEAAWGKNNLGVWARETSKLKFIGEARESYDSAIEYFEKARNLNPSSSVAMQELANSLSGRAFLELNVGDAKSSREIKLKEIRIWTALVEKYPDDIPLNIEKAKTSMDFYNDFFLTYIIENEYEAQLILNEFYNLTKVDIENFSNMKYFLNAATSKFYHLPLEILEHRHNQISHILSLYQASDEDDTLYYDTLLNLIQVRINYLKGNIDSAKKGISKLDYENLDFAISDTMRAELHYAMFVSYVDLDQEKSANSNANAFLNLVGSEELKLPKVSDYKIKALTQLDRCKEVIPLAIDLVARGYKTETWKNQPKCT